MINSREKIKEYKQQLLREQLALCTERQQDFFWKIFPKGPSEKQMEDALDLIDRTIIKNQNRHPG